MDLQFGAAYDTLREEVRAFCRESWPLRGEEAQLPEREQAILWRKRALAAGFLHRTVPRAYGGAGVEPDILAETLLREELDAAGVPIPGYGGSENATTYTNVDELRMTPKWTRPLADLKGRVIRLRFRIQHAEVFAFQVAS